MVLSGKNREIDKYGRSASVTDVTGIFDKMEKSNNDVLSAGVVSMAA